MIFMLFMRNLSGSTALLCSPLCVSAGFSWEKKSFVTEQEFNSAVISAQILREYEAISLVLVDESQQQVLNHSQLFPFNESPEMSLTAQRQGED